MNIRRRDFLGTLAALAAMPAVAQTTRPASPGLVSLNWDGRPGTKKHKVDPLDEFFETGPLPRLRIDLDPVEMRLLDRNPKTVIRAQITESTPGHPDRQYCDVGVHLKGSYGSMRPLSDKPGLTLNFDKFVDGQDFHGLDKVHLNNSVQDGSYMCENLGGWVFRECGVPAPRVSAARVWLNDRDLGAYVLKEGFDKPFFNRYFHNHTGNVYESNFGDVDRNMPVHFPGPKPIEPTEIIDPADFETLRQQQTQWNQLRAKAYARLRELVDACREIDVDDRMRAVERVLDVERCFTFLAGEAMLAHWDGYATARNNYRVYDDPKSGKLVMLPHGMDQLFQRPEHSLYGNNSLLPMALAANNNVAGKKRYLDRVAEIRRGPFRTETLMLQFERIKARITPLFAEISAATATKHASRAELLRKRIVERCGIIDEQLVTPPKPLRFDAAGVAVLTHWRPAHQDDFGDAETDQFEEDGKPRLRVTVKAPGGAASWRCAELLPTGTYTFYGRMKTVDVVARRPSPTSQNGLGACLRLSGSRTASRVVGTTEWHEVSYTFTVSNTIKHCAFVCELSAGSGQAIFDPDSLRLKRTPRQQVVPQRAPLDLPEGFVVPQQR